MQAQRCGQFGRCGCDGLNSWHGHLPSLDACLCELECIDIFGLVLRLMSLSPSTWRFRGTHPPLLPGPKFFCFCWLQRVVDAKIFNTKDLRPKYRLQMG